MKIWKLYLPGLLVYLDLHMNIKQQIYNTKLHIKYYKTTIYSIIVENFKIEHMESKVQKQHHDVNSFAFLLKPQET